jgi:hypothetical protein
MEYTVVSYHGTSRVGRDAVLSSHNWLYRSIVFHTSNSQHHCKWNWQNQKWQNQDDHLSHQGGQMPFKKKKKQKKGYLNKTPKLVKNKRYRNNTPKLVKKKGTRIRHQNPLLNDLHVHYHMPPFFYLKKIK